MDVRKLLIGLILLCSGCHWSGEATVKKYWVDPLSPYPIETEVRIRVKNADRY